MRRWIQSQWFLTALAAVLLAGWWGARTELLTGDTPWLVRCADDKLYRNGVVASVLFLMAWPLPTAELLRTLKRPGPALLAAGINMGLLPLLAYPLSRWGHVDLGTGLIVTSAVPCTLASAAVWTRRAGGNDATAILVTLLTNGSCFLITPLWLVTLTGQRVEIPMSTMIFDLGLIVVLPMALAQLLRFQHAAAQWATDHKVTLALIAQLGILWMVFAGAINCGRSWYGLSAAGSDPADQLSLIYLLAMFAQVILLHLCGWWVGWSIARALGMARADQIAVGFAGSQKTLMVGLKIADTYFGGLTILPMLAYHVLQLLIDTLLADRLRNPASSVPSPPSDTVTNRERLDSTARTP